MSSAIDIIQTSGVNDVFAYNEIHLDSTHRDDGDNNSPGFTIQPAVTRILGLKLLTAEIPFSFYIVNATNNQFKYNGISTSIPEGNYNSTTIKQALSNATNQTLAFTLIPDSYRFRVDTVDSSHFTLDFDASSPTTVLGFPPGHYDSGSTSTVVAPNTASLTGPTCLYLTSSQIAGRIQQNVRTFGSSSPNPSIVAKIPLDVNPGEILVYKDPQPAYVFEAGLDTLQHVDIQLLWGDTLRPVNLNGLGWSITFQVLTQRDTSVTRYVNPDSRSAAGSKRIRV